MLGREYTRHGRKQILGGNTFASRLVKTAEGLSGEMAADRRVRDATE